MKPQGKRRVGEGGFAGRKPEAREDPCHGTEVTTPLELGTQASDSSNKTPNLDLGQKSI